MRESRDGRLPRTLGVWSGAAVMVGLMIGSGIFRVPGVVAGHVGTLGGLGLLWLVGGLLALAGALSLAELATLYPRTGGIYVYLHEVYGPMAAFVYGWTRLLVLAPASVGAIALICGAYLEPLVPGDRLGERTLAGLVIVVLAALNYRSLKASAWTENALSGFKWLGLLALAAVCFWLGDGTGGAFASAARAPSGAWAAFGLALVTVMWTYSGWSSVTAMAGEMRDPSRTLPRALGAGVLAVIVAYLAVNAGYLWLLPVEEAAGSSLIAADAVGSVAGPAGRRAVAALVAVSTFGAAHAAMIYNPRIFWAMAEDRLLFPRFAEVHDRYATPHLSVLLTAGLGIAFVSVRTFEQLAEAFILGTWPFHVAVVAGVLLLRRRRPDLERPYRVPGYPAVPLLFIGVSVAMVVAAVWQRPVSGAVSFGAILSGVPVYWLLGPGRKGGGR